MPRLSRWFIRAAMMYFILALLVGVALGAQAVWAIIPVSADLLSPYFHLLAEGWLTMLIIGVAFWMFPRYSLERPHNSEILGWASFGLLNLGLLLRVVSEPVNAVLEEPGSLWAILLTIAAAFQWLGGLAFVTNTWKRVKER